MIWFASLGGGGDPFGQCDALKLTGEILALLDMCFGFLYSPIWLLKTLFYIIYNIVRRVKFKYGDEDGYVTGVALPAYHYRSRSFIYLTKGVFSF